MYETNDKGDILSIDNNLEKVTSVTICWTPPFHKMLTVLVIFSKKLLHHGVVIIPNIF